VCEAKRWLVEHLHDHYSLYGEFSGVRSARKHIGWYLRDVPGGEPFMEVLNTLENCELQVLAVENFMDELNQTMDRMPSHLMSADAAAELVGVEA